MRKEFAHKWTRPPGSSIRDWMVKKNISNHELMAKLALNELEFDMIMDGRRAITPALAELLESFVGGSKIFWMRREAQYRDDLVRLEDIDNDFSPRQCMPKVNGSVFRCECGCNVFTEYSELKYRCNGCRELYSGER